LTMTRVFNNTAKKDKRRELRNHMTPAEKRLWLMLRGKQFLGTKWRRQYSVGPYVVDFYCPSSKLAIELDGDSHFGGGAEDRDANRQAYLESFGIRVIRFVNQDVFGNLPRVLEEIAKTIEETARDRAVLRSEEKTPPAPPC
jgi:very-short-patch-repair endonuclease